MLRCLAHSVDLSSCRTSRLGKPGEHGEGCLVFSPVRLVVLALFQFPWSLLVERLPMFRGFGRIHHPTLSDGSPTTESEDLNCP